MQSEPTKCIVSSTAISGVRAAAAEEVATEHASRLVSQSKWQTEGEERGEGGDLSVYC